MNKQEEIALLVKTIKSNMDFLTDKNSIPVITAAEDRNVLDGISRGLNRLEGVVVVTGIITNKLYKELGELIKESGSIVICSDVDSSALDEVLQEGDIIPVIDIHVDVKNVENLTRTLKQKGARDFRKLSFSETMVEVIAEIVSSNKNLVSVMKEVSIGRKKFTNEIENSVYKVLTNL